MVTGIRRVSSARSVRSWTQTGAHRPSVSVSKPGCMYILKEEAEENDKQDPKQGPERKPTWLWCPVTFQSLKSQQHFNVKGTPTLAFAKQTSLYLKQGRVL